jgi:hypothetical protein
MCKSNSTQLNSNSVLISRCAQEFRISGPPSKIAAIVHRDWPVWRSSFRRFASMAMQKRLPRTALCRLRAKAVGACSGGAAASRRWLSGR